MFLNTLFLLLPIAAVSGWWLGWRSAKKKFVEKKQNIPLEYFKGLNYLINEQSDRATLLFLKVLDVDDETIELHYALASLFLKRGEVDRAIRIYQNLLARPTLSKEQRNETLYYLASGYLKAGVLDRAEGLFSDLTSDANYGFQSLKSLLNIFQQQKDWLKAIDVAHRLRKRDRESYSIQIAHYHCELAQQQPVQSKEWHREIRAALSSDPNCARASLMKGEVLLSDKHYRQALNIFKKVEKQDALHLHDALPSMLICWSFMGESQQAMSYLESLMMKFPSLDVLLFYADLGIATNSGAEFKAKLRSYVVHYPSLRGLLSLLKAECVCQNIIDDVALAESIVNMESKELDYQCTKCGFLSHSLHWQCPRCQEWGNIYRINSVV